MAVTVSVLSYRTFPCCPISRTVVVISPDLGFSLGWFSLLIRSFVLFQPRKKAKLMVEDPTDLELVNTPLRREVKKKRVFPSGTPSSDGMTSAAKLWEDIEKVLAGGCESIGKSFPSGP